MSCCSHCDQEMRDAVSCLPLPTVEDLRLVGIRIETPLIEFAKKVCHDCGVSPYGRHHPGCDVARCKGCGRQAIQCSAHTDLTQWPSTIWTGRWPGDVEVEEGLAADLNDLAVKGGTRQLVWSAERERFVTVDAIPS